MKRIAILVRMRRVTLIGVNDHTPRRVEDLLAEGVEVSLFCHRVPIALLPQVVDGLVRHGRRMPRPEDLQGMDAVFIQTADPVADRAWRAMAEEQGVRTVLVENLRRETSQPETFHCGPFALTIHPVRPIRALRLKLRLFQRFRRQARAVASRPAGHAAAGAGLET